MTININEPGATPANPPVEPATKIAMPIKPAPGEAGILRQMQLGFMFSHSLMGETNRQLLAAATAAFAVADLLVEKGLLDEDSLKARRDAVEAVLMKQVESSGVGLFVNESHKDKYELTELPHINCAERVHLCRAACCALRFPLSRQDVQEGKVHWDFGRPYWNLRDQTGYCVHNDQTNKCCNVYDARPGPCRLFDCRQDKRIWLDFDGMVANPELVDNISGQ